MKHLDLFSGIGGFALAVDQVVKAEHVFCDNDLFCQKVIKKHWPKSKIYGDIREITEETADLVTGGFPCQPFSQAGKRNGTQDNRYLWPEMLRVIQLAKPTWVIAENVSGIINIEGGLVFEKVCFDLESEGYEVQPFIIPALSVNAPHRRERVWFVAYSEHNGRDKTKEVGENSNAQSKSKTWKKLSVNEFKRANSIWGKEFGRNGWERNWHEVASKLCRVDDGVSEGLDKTRRIKALGNAIVPGVAIEIIKALGLTNNT